MAEFYTDFSEENTGETPEDWSLEFNADDSDWNVRSGGSEHTGGQYLELAPGSTGTNVLSWDLPGEGSDLEILYKSRITENGDYHTEGYLRGGGSAGDEDGYHGSLRADVDNRLVAKYVNGGFTQLSGAGFTFEVDTWYWHRLRVNDDEFMARLWEDGEEEPSGWEFSETDTDLTSGWVGIGTWDDNRQEFDIVSVGTEGDTAPDDVLAETFEVSIDNDNLPVTEPNPVDIDYTITNTGGSPGEQTIELYVTPTALLIDDFDGGVIRSEWLRSDSVWETSDSYSSEGSHSLTRHSSGGSERLAGDGFTFEAHPEPGGMYYIVDWFADHWTAQSVAADSYDTTQSYEYYLSPRFDIDELEFYERDDGALSLVDGTAASFPSLGTPVTTIISWEDDHEFYCEAWNKDTETEIATLNVNGTLSEIPGDYWGVGLGSTGDTYVDNVRLSENHPFE